MTPERLQEIRERNRRDADWTWVGRDRRDLLDYIDLLHEDLRITRAERDHAKHQALEHRKARAKAEDERDAYRRGQGPAPTPATGFQQGANYNDPTGWYPIPNSRGDDQ